MFLAVQKFRGNLTYLGSWKKTYAGRADLSYAPIKVEGFHSDLMNHLYYQV
jgi:hypothetical protein